eukprot:gnl/Ergobibamus_cyprinoides/1200.p1 GENE.gnl/Ergobibamus_cyprinoides/1200~~gnl/Ergobibamus_cyprinoides/1200.p1  ORF type:complete len:151 (+),score=24.66 gnl/Ergobibamus_cyprinoides/1200:563-1015(+)
MPTGREMTAAEAVAFAQAQASAGRMNAAAVRSGVAPAGLAPTADRVQLSRSGVPLGVIKSRAQLDAEAAAHADADADAESDSEAEAVNLGESRPRAETAEEKRERKKAFKAAAASKKAAKKAAQAERETRDRNKRRGDTASGREARIRPL